MFQISHFTQLTIYKFFCFKIEIFKIEIKTKADLYMSFEAMAHSAKLILIQMEGRNWCFHKDVMVFGHVITEKL